MKNRKKSVGRKLKLASLLILLAYLVLPAVAMAFGQDPSPGGTEAQAKLCGVMGNVHSILKVASILIVTVAIIFAGYQIAFAHKRISDVAPILIGGLLIGAAGQLAVMVIGNGDFSQDCATAMVMPADQVWNA
ncbi:TrbC/VirB2 family protein [Thermomonas fusca]|uniref:Type VI secretion protein n=1 Tax=Thermomonas fusca TaxID=215690 RepID=A0A5R9PE45_9GAMM|nr:TrbC/VirB2 family protein [Thermomonas fusca]TLX20860.1 type VI secretion protein [Thermomonas fusca]